MPLHDWSEVVKARNVADEAASRAHGEDDGAINRQVAALEAHRLELRALGITISHAIDEGLRARR